VRLYVLKRAYPCPGKLDCLVIRAMTPKGARKIAFKEHQDPSVLDAGTFTVRPFKELGKPAIVTSHRQLQ
jgi:hypothetical protein